MRSKRVADSSKSFLVQIPRRRVESDMGAGRGDGELVADRDESREELSESRLEGV